MYFQTIVLDIPSRLPSCSPDTASPSNSLRILIISNLLLLTDIPPLPLICVTSDLKVIIDVCDGAHLRDARKDGQVQNWMR